MHHPDLSPLLWHLGHLLYIEQYWVGERLAGRETDKERAHLFRPDGLRKTARGQQVPSLQVLIQEWDSWNVQCEDHLSSRSENGADHPLMRDHYVLHFLIQHHSQHVEIMRQILSARALKTRDRAFEPSLALAAAPLSFCYRNWDYGSSLMGWDEGPVPYDNERPRHSISLPAFTIAERPVANAEYLNFMEAGGYQKESYWSQEGWRWRQWAQAEAPWHWRRSPNGHWYGIDDTGTFTLAPDAPVTGLNAYEVNALARFARARLPTEQEWEAAARSGLLDQTGTVWEWCATAFYPYPGFRAFPYRGYSLPWFDGVHLTLRGGSRYSDPTIRRPSFRNFYVAHKRHIFAGARLCRYHHCPQR